MSVVQDDVSICAMPNKYAPQSQLIKDLINHFEPAQKDRIQNNQKNMAEERNQHQILLWACAHLHYFIGRQSYTERELQYVCISMILLKTTYPVIFQEYGVPKSSLNRYLSKIYPLLQSRNLFQLQNRVEVGEISPGKVRAIVKLTV